MVVVNLAKEKDFDFFYNIKNNEFNMYWTGYSTKPEYDKLKEFFTEKIENQNIESKVNPKILRKSFALHLIKNGVSINTVSEIFGIDNLNFLLREATNKQSYIEIKDFFKNK